MNALNGWTHPSPSQSHSCGCIGPQNGKPLCPCRMRSVQVKDGRYVEVIDHGPVEKGVVGSDDFRSIFHHSV